MKYRVASMILVAILVGGCASAPNPSPNSQVVASAHRVKLTLEGAEVAGIPGPFCQAGGKPTDLGTRCEEGRKRIEELGKDRKITRLDPSVTVVFPGMDQPKFQLQFAEQPVRYSVTLWGAHPTADPPGALWLHRPVEVSPSGAFPVPPQRNFQIYEVQADWSDGSHGSYVFPLETTHDYLDLNRFMVNEVSLGLVDGVVWVHGQSSEANTFLKPVVEALKRAKLDASPGASGTPDFTVALHNHWNVDLSLAVFRGKGVLVTAGNEMRWTTSEELVAALEPLGKKSPKPPLIGREKVEAIAKGYDSKVKWDSPSFHEKMAVTVDG